MHGAAGDTAQGSVMEVPCHPRAALPGEKGDPRHSTCRPAPPRPGTGAVPAAPRATPSGPGEEGTAVRSLLCPHHFLPRPRVPSPPRSTSLGSAPLPSPSAAGMRRVSPCGFPLSQRLSCPGRAGLRLPAPAHPMPTQDGFPRTVPVRSQPRGWLPGTARCPKPGCERLHAGLRWQRGGQRPLTVAHDQSCICLPFLSCTILGLQLANASVCT